MKKILVLCLVLSGCNSMNHDVFERHRYLCDKHGGVIFVREAIRLTHDKVDLVKLTCVDGSLIDATFNGSE